MRVWVWGWARVVDQRGETKLSSKLLQATLYFLEQCALLIGISLGICKDIQIISLNKGKQEQGYGAVTLLHFSFLTETANPLKDTLNPFKILK